MNKIIGCPEGKYEYEFMVVTETENKDFMWRGNYEDAQAAYEYAKLIGGMVAHNVRVSHKKLKKGVDK